MRHSRVMVELDADAMQRITRQFDLSCGLGIAQVWREVLLAETLPNQLDEMCRELWAIPEGAYARITGMVLRAAGRDFPDDAVNAKRAAIGLWNQNGPGWYRADELVDTVWKV